MNGTRRLSVTACAVAAAALMLAACGNPSSDSSASGGSGGGDEANPAGGSSPKRPLVVYHRSGGFAGLQQFVRIAPDGTARITNEGRERSVRLGPAALDRITQMLDEVDWSVAGRDHTSKAQAVSDGMLYELRYGSHFARGYGFTAKERSLRGVLALMDDLVFGPEQTTAKDD